MAELPYVSFAQAEQREGETMALFDDEPARRRKTHEIGQDLSLLSVGDLAERIGQLEAEIERLRADMAAKDATKSAAEALFRR